MQFIVGLVGRSRRFRFERSGRSHRIFSSYSNTIEELRPPVRQPHFDSIHNPNLRITNDPSIKGSSPRSSQHDQTKRHDQSILYQPKSPSNPITFKSNRNLPYDNPNNLKIIHGRNPIVVAHFMGFPTLRPYSLIQRRQVSDRE